VGTGALRRFVRPVCFQDVPEALLPVELREANPLGLWRTVDGALKQA
jgi:NADP-dependent aldehyde dehydrogenase